MNAMRRRSLSLALLAWPFSHAARALEPPDGKVLLTIKGRVTKPNAGKEAVFTMDMLAALPQRTYKVAARASPSGFYEFTGPLMKDVLEAAGASGSKITALGTDNYSVEIPFTDAAQVNPIISIRRDGQTMSVRERGPLWLMYPLGSTPELSEPKYVSRSAFLLKQLTVE